MPNINKCKISSAGTTNLFVRLFKSFSIYELITIVKTTLFQASIVMVIIFVEISDLYRIYDLT